MYLTLFPFKQKERSNSNVPTTIGQEKEVIPTADNPLRRYRKRPHTGTVTNKTWCELADYKKLVAKTKVDKLRKDMQLTDILIEQNKLKNKLLELEYENKKKQQ